MSRSYDGALICLNGHVVNSSIHDFPQFNSERCSECGEVTVSDCSECGTEVRGSLRGVVSASHLVAKPFCHACGRPYPWTQRKMEAAQELAEELEGLTQTERKILTENLSDLTTETPRTMAAAVKVKKVLSKASGWAVGALRRDLEDSAVDQAKEILFGAGS